MAGSAVGNACRLVRSCKLIALTLALFSTCAWPQTQLATVFGIVTDTSGAVIPGAEVTIVNQGTGLKRGVLTDVVGQYRLAGLPTGTYAIRIEKQGFQTQLRDGIALVSASELMINLSLSLGEREEQITVSAGLAGIDNTTSTISGIVAEQTLTELPINGRDLFNAAILE